VGFSDGGIERFRKYLLFLAILIQPVIFGSFHPRKRTEMFFGKSI
jgi:hypothetical protein